MSADGKGEIFNLTGSGYFSSSPRWVMDGNAILFSTERYGMRNHASWGSLEDAMLIFLNQDAYDKFRLSKEDYELQKKEQEEADKDKKKEGKEADKDKKTRKKPTRRKKRNSSQWNWTASRTVSCASRPTLQTWVMPSFRPTAKVFTTCRPSKAVTTFGRWTCASAIPNC